MILAHTGFGGGRLAMPLLALHQGGSEWTVGVLMSMLMVVPAFTAVHMGRWVDRAGYLRPTALAVGALAAAQLCVSLVQALAVLAAACVVMGTAFTLVSVAVNNALGHLAGSAGRTRLFGFMALGFSLSSLLGPIVAGAAIDALGYAWTFAVLAVLPILAGLLLPGAPRVTPPERADGGVPAAAVMDLLRISPLRAVLVASSLVAAGADLFTFLVPLHGARSGLSATAIGLVAGAYGVGSATSRLALPWITRRVSEWRLIGAALSLAALGYLAFPFCERFATMLPLAFTLGLVLGSGQPVVMGLLHVSAPPERTGEAVGLRASLISFGQMVLPLAVGGIGSAWGLAPLFWGIAVVLGCGGYAARRRHLRQLQRPQEPG